jgi:hypothetical protein
VVWVETTNVDAGQGGSGYSKLWEVGTAVSSEDRCFQLRNANVRERAARMQKSYKDNMKSDADSVTVFPRQGSFITERYVCLPDSVDPRAPKGK